MSDMFYCMRYNRSYLGDQTTCVLDDLPSESVDHLISENRHKYMSYNA